MNVTGTVTLDGSLDVVRFNGFSPSAGDTFTIIANDGDGITGDAVIGTFDGLNEGETFTADTVTYSISYVGGDGNDVVLTALYQNFVVINTNDSGAGSLRQAMLDANVHSGLDVIEFNISGTGPHTIAPTSGLPTITDPVIIDATSEPDYAGIPVIDLDGSSAGVAERAFWFQGASAGSEVHGLAIRGWDSSGIQINVDNVLIADNYIGVQPDGVTGDGNTLHGVYVTVGSGTVIDGNLISGNTQDGIRVDGTSTNTVITDNIIGLAAGGSSLLTTGAGAQDRGVYVRGLFSGTQPGPVRIGTDGNGNNDTAEGNVISGNAQSGIEINFSDNHIIAGNLIGTSASGTVDFGNGSRGVYIVGGSGTTIGGDIPVEGNVISGNQNYGIELGGTDDVTISGNRVGTNAVGDRPVPNAAGGIYVGNFATNTTIGGSGADERNVISGNADHGITVSGATGTTIIGNTIGLDSQGDGVIDGQLALWQMDGGAVTDAIGTNDPSQQAGLTFTTGFAGDAVNHGGSGLIDIPQGTLTPSEVTLDAWVRPDGASSNPDQFGGRIVGKTESGSRALSINWRSTDDKFVFVFGNIFSEQIVSANSFPTGTFYHVAATYDGSTARLYVDGQLEASLTTNTTLGYNAAEPWTIGNDGPLARGAGVTRHFNGLIDDVGLYERTLSQTEISDIIARGASGKAVPLGNSAAGIVITGGAADNMIGGDTAGAGNVISANTAEGILLDAAGLGNEIQGNYVGLDATGAWDRGNSGDGIVVNSTSPIIRNNVISGNAGDGIDISGTGNGIDQSAVLWLQGENDFTDATGQNDGSNVGGVTFATGVSGQAFQLNGSTQHVEVPDSASLDVTTELTVDAWINPAALSGGSSAFYTIATKYDSQANAISWGFWAKQGGKLDFRVSSDGTTANTRIIETSNAVLSLNQFTHVAATFDAVTQEAKIYVDGVEVPTTVVQNVNVPSIANTATPVRVGAFRNTSGIILGHFNGRIDDPAIYSSALSARQVATIYGIGGGGKQGAVITANFIGTNADGDGAIGNAVNGISLVNGADGTIIGTDGDGNNDGSEGNVISGHAARGISISSTDNTVIAGNIIGLSADGLNDLQLSLNQVGVYVESGSGTLIGSNADGTSDDAERNVISGHEGNGGAGVHLRGGAVSTTIAGNYIGTDYTGLTSVANRTGVVGFTAQPFVVGGSIPAERNIISGNTWAGVLIQGSSNNRIQGNYIGLGPDGDTIVGNSVGVHIKDQSFNNVIGTDGDGTNDATEGNVISGNTSNGIEHFGGHTGPATTAIIAGNIIGLDKTGEFARPNANNGILIGNGLANGAIIGTDGDGTSDEEERNIISGNAGNGVLLQNGAYGAVIAGNYIGTNALGTGSLDGTVSWWRGEQSTVDQAGTNEGTLQGDAGFTGGLIGDAFAFDGAGDYLEILDTDDSLDVGTSFTVETWFNTNDPLFGAGQLSLGQPIISQGFTSADSKQVVLAVDQTGVLEFVVRGTTAGFEDFIGTTPLAADTWYHAAFTYDGTQGQLYLNGQLEDSGTTTINLDANSRTLVGAFENAFNSDWSYFSGEIDEPAIYDRALSPTRNCCHRRQQRSRQANRQCR